MSVLASKSSFWTLETLFILYLAIFLVTFPGFKSPKFILRSIFSRKVRVKLLWEQVLNFLFLLFYESHCSPCLQELGGRFISLGRHPVLLRWLEVQSIALVVQRVSKNNTGWEMVFCIRTWLIVVFHGSDRPRLCLPYKLFLLLS